MKARTVSICLVPMILCGLLAEPAYATFHFMQIEQVIGGVNGDTTAQAIQLRMRSSSQNFVAAARIRAFDANGMNPITVINIGANVPNGGSGVRVLITSTNFDALTSPATTPDFTMTNLIPASYLAAGSLTFESDGGIIYWRLSWGGAAYTGSNAGSCTNDNSACPTPGDFGPPWPGPLPSTTTMALLFQGSAGALSTTNAADYALTPGAATFTNNAGASFTLIVSPVDCPADLDGDLDVDAADLAELLSSWGPCAGCPADFDTDGDVDAADLAQLLSAWGPC